jgi:hypothetical protein
MQDLITLQATDAAQVAADAAKIVVDEAQVTTDQATQTTDTATQATDAGTFASALLVTGPVATVSADGLSVQIDAAPGVVISPNTPYPVASSVPIPAPAPLPVTIPSGS